MVDISHFFCCLYFSAAQKPLDMGMDQTGTFNGTESLWKFLFKKMGMEMIRVMI